MRARSDTFSDHYSQAPIEQHHLASALIFELSKVTRPEVRVRMVSHLLNIDTALAQTVADGLRVALPQPARAMKPTRTDLAPSNALSIVKRNPQTFAGRKLGVLVSDGVDIGLFNAVKDAVAKEGAMMEVIAPAVGGVKASDGSMNPDDQKIDGAPLVLYDAVALLLAEPGLPALMRRPPARDFASDAYVHAKYIGCTPAAVALLNEAGIGTAMLDAGTVQLKAAGDMGGYITAVRNLRYWDRPLKTEEP